MIETIIFDGEGVVMNTERLWDRAQAELLRSRGLTYDRDKIKPLITGRSLMEGTEVIKHEYGLRESVEVLAKERFEIVRSLFENEIAFVDGFLKFYERVRNTCKTCLATSLDSELLKIAENRLGLSRLFGNRIFTLADVRYRSKPSPDLFLYAALQLGSKPENCVALEDAPLGVVAAKRAGMKCIAIATTYKRELLKDADTVVDSFSEIEIT